MISLLLHSPIDFSRNILQVAVDSEIDFLTDALDAATHKEDKDDYGSRLRTMNRFKILLETEACVFEFQDEDPSAEHLAMALEKLIMEQSEIIEDFEGEERQEIGERIDFGKAMLSALRPNRPEHYGSRH